VFKKANWRRYLSN